MLVRKGNKLAERIVLGNVIEDEISTDMTSNYNPKDGYCQGSSTKAKVAYSKPNISSKHDPCLVPKDPSGTQTAKLLYFHANCFCSMD